MTETLTSEGTIHGINPETFAAHFSSGRIATASYDTFPNEFRSVTDIPSYKRGLIFAITHDGGGKTYGVKDSLMDRIYLHDRSDTDEYLGHGEIDHETFDGINKPTVGDSFTAVQHRKNGLGMRRLKMMDALSRMVYQTPLTSGVIIHNSEKDLWEKLVEDGKAERIPSGKGPQRYRFIA
jgi:hypothetical protein